MSDNVEYDYVDKNHPEDLVCCICLMPFVNPLACPSCQHMFCAVHTPGLANCPLCRELWTGRSLASAPRALLNLLNKFLVRCPNSSCERGRGGAPLQRGDLASHLQQCALPCAHSCGTLVAPRDVETHNASCVAFVLTCGSPGCTHRAPRAAMPAHQAECPAAVVACPHGCPHRGPRRDSATHDAVCPSVAIACPHGCGVRLARGDLATHETSCPEKVVACASADLGCSYTAARKSLAEHQQSCLLPRRLVQLERALEEAQRRIEATEQRLQQQQQAFDQALVQNNRSLEQQLMRRLDQELAQRIDKMLTQRLEQQASSRAEAVCATRSTQQQSAFDQYGFNREGFNREGFNREGFNLEGFNREGFNREGFNREGFNREGFNRDGFDREGFDQRGLNREGFNRQGVNSKGVVREAASHGTTRVCQHHKWRGHCGCRVDGVICIDLPHGQIVVCHHGNFKSCCGNCHIDGVHCKVVNGTAPTVTRVCRHAKWRGHCGCPVNGSHCIDLPFGQAVVCHHGSFKSCCGNCYIDGVHCKVVSGSAHHAASGSSSPQTPCRQQ